MGYSVQPGVWYKSFQIEGTRLNVMSSKPERETLTVNVTLRTFALMNLQGSATQPVNHCMQTAFDAETVGNDC